MTEESRPHCGKNRKEPDFWWQSGWASMLST